ncbi:glycosyltransferase family 2 protein [Bacteroides bouchesdurhonensis]|uniref:glycosyltransferase family 2 protein n=1 Tax=Bacteroides bouchesdurhonensis TaxID=1841855 RepID=UPI00101AEB04|nr:hypothetical protein [Bacteroides bouchesdurhonensis]
MEFYKYIYVVLVYKNIDVLEDFFRTLDFKQSKVIVVNSYFDDSSLKKCSEVANKNNADFIPIPNKGFSYGNNIGTKYALEHYNFEFLILSNSDIKIKDLSGLSKFEGKEMVIAPETVLRNGKRQNPDTPWNLRFIYPMLEISFRYNLKLLYTLCHIFTRVSRELFRLFSFLFRKDKYRIFSAHGSFIIFTEKSVEKLYPFFDDRMFLYNEEWFLALKARKCQTPIYYIPELKVLHLEGASSDLSSFYKYDKESFSILNEWRKHNCL